MCVWRLGTAWIVLVPAEFLGVTSGLGYAINDARDTLSYDRLAALVLLIGLIGFALDFVLAHWSSRVALDADRLTPSPDSIEYPSHRRPS